MTSLRGRVATQLVRAIRLKQRLERLADVEGDPIEFGRQLRSLRRADRRTPPLTVKRRWECTTLDVSGFPLHVMTSKTGVGRSMLLYLHGGGYMFGPFATEWRAMSSIAAATGSGFSMFLYPRAPEHDATRCVEVTLEAWSALGQRYGADDIVLMGASAGGGLAVALMMSLRDRGAALPRLAILLSPGVDMTLATDVADRESGDVMVPSRHVRSAGAVYAGDLGAEHPIVSPTFGDLAALPDMHVFAGSRELLLPSIADFARRASDAGTTVNLVVGDHQQHTWPVAPTPEGRSARGQIADIIRRH